MAIVYPDLSHYSWDRAKGNPDWAALRAAGVQVVCIRATYGDPQVYAPTTRYFREMATAARHAGLWVGGYHNLIRGDDASMSRQVEWFRAELDAVAADWAMLDVEPYEALKANGLWPRLEDVLRFEQRWYALEAHRVLAIYLARWFWARPADQYGLGAPDLTVLRGPLVASNYPASAVENPTMRYEAVGGDTGPGWQPYGGLTPAVWQFGSTLTWPGVSDTEDANAYRGTLDDFKTLTRRETPVGWYLNRALTNFRAAVNAAYPYRDRGSDGTIGDPAHLSRTSDHNPDPAGEPDAGSVDAWDMDVEVNGVGKPYAEDVEQLKRLFEAHESSKYWIHNDQISFRSEGWKPRSYSYAGENRNRHIKHVHFNTRESHESSTAPWPINLEGDDMPTEQEIWGWDGIPNPYPSKDTNPNITPATALNHIGAHVVQLHERVGNLSTSLLTAINAVAAKDAVDEAALAAALSSGVATAVLAQLPEGSDQVSQEEVSAAVLAAFRQAFGATAQS